MAASSGLQAPGRPHGLVGALRNGFLLKLIVDKEIQVRYRGSVLGLLWSYIKPAVQFGVFYLALGVFLGLDARSGGGIQHYAIYLFSGIAIMNLFSETFGNAARSIVGNGGLIKKIYLPRELFPLSSLWVAMIHFLPQVLVLLIACIAVGWHPDLLQIASVFLAFLIVGVFSLGIGLVFATADVFFRDAENIVDLINMVATWLSPVLYQWMMVRDTLGDVVFGIYMLNPLSVAVELFHYGFWFPTLTEEAAWHVPPQFFSVWVPVALGVAFLFLFLGDSLFRRFSGRFAQEL
ncbi:MAG TPA: ABC transporter permease [Actinomycetaceae bacterium]|nr:ABC transporter permease [Actinomycetaceae bacterium]